MDQEQKEALANFAKSTDVSIRALLAAMEAAGGMIEELKERVSTLERKVEGSVAELRIKEGVAHRRISALEGEYIQALKRGEGNGEEDSNSCEPTQD